MTFNGWPTLAPGSPMLHRWLIPGSGTPKVVLPLRHGSAGFLLAHNAQWFDEVCERLDRDNIRDDWGYANRPPSNHASGTASDLNSTRHPFHVPISRTFTRTQTAAIRRHLRLYEGAVDWGGDWRDPDGMHFEISPGTKLADTERVARKILNGRRSRQILAANPGQRKVILS